MGMTLAGGVFNEDFNYGYPYNLQIPLSPPEFNYSNEVHVFEGNVFPEPYSRKQFTLHYKNRKDEPNNYDKGVHGGSQTTNFYYLIFPQIQWDDVQTFTMVVHLSAAATLSYDRSFDGYKTDRIYLVVNRKVMHMHSHSAGHGWTTDSTALRAGWNTISWVLKTGSYIPPVTHGGTTVKARTPPKLPRYFRLTNINISGHVTALPVAPFPWVPMSSDTITTFRGTVEALPRVTMKVTSYMGAGKPSGECDMIVNTSFITDSQTEADLGAATMAADSTMTGVASSDQFHESYDGGFGLESYGDLQLEVPIDIPQNILSLVKPMVSTTVTMPQPFIIQGRPFLPVYNSVQTSSITTAHSYVYSDAPSPTSINHVLPVASTHRWVATDVGGADDAAITSWPEHSGGPAWTSAGIYSPTVHPHTFFHNESLSLQTYGRVVHMWWRYVQHMWMDLGAPQNVPYTWMVAGIFHPMNLHLWQNILDFGAATPTTYDDQVNEGDVVSISDGFASGGLLGLAHGGTAGTTYLNAQMSDGHSVYKAATLPSTRPLILTFVRVPGAINCYISGYKLWEHHTLYGGQAGNQQWVLGRRKNTVSELAASHMSLFEIAYWNRALALTEVETVSNYLQGVYLFTLYK